MDENQRPDRRLNAPLRRRMTIALLMSGWLPFGIAIGLMLMLVLWDRPRRPEGHGDEKRTTGVDRDPDSHWDGADDDATLRADRIPFDEQARLPEQAAHFEDGSKARVLIVRGVLTVFSLGMDELAKKLRAEGYDVLVSVAANSNNVARKMRDEIKAPRMDRELDNRELDNRSLDNRPLDNRPLDNRPLVIIGHSLGGDLAPKLAATFGEWNIPVDVLIMLDSTMPSAPPANVRRCINLYQSNVTPEWARVFRGTDVQVQSRQTEIINIDIRKMAGKKQTSGIHHFNIDANPWIHELIVDAVNQSVAALGRGDPEQIPVSTVNQPVHQLPVDQPPNPGR